MDYQKKVKDAVKNKQLLNEAETNIAIWLNNDKYQEYQAEIKNLIEQENWEELNDSFFKILPFGTGGRRGTVGVGPNRINKITIGESAQGLADYLKSTGEETKEQGIVVANDTRLTATEFTQLTAQVLAANDFKVYLFEDFRSTPELSFAVRYLKTSSGVVVSASHNPSKDNGFKAYWNDGGQVVSPNDKNLINFVDQVEDIKQTDFEEAKKDNKIIMIGQEVDEAYYQAVLDESMTSSRSCKIVYSPLHGAGSSSVLPIIKKAGFEIITVEEQLSPDGSFPNIENNIPNPEVPTASDMATQYAKDNDADIAITTDPDADRLGVIAKDDKNKYHFLNGNQIAALIGFFVLDQTKQQNLSVKNPFIVKTIVTTDLLNALAKNYNVKSYNNILIGFKYVAELIRTQEDEGDEKFLFGGEESHGILKGSYVRDKDAAIAALMIAELASHLKDQGKNLIWQLNELYRQYGIYTETLSSTYYEGADGNEKMRSIMSSLRKNPPQKIQDEIVHTIIDRLNGTVINPKDNKIIDNNDGTKGDVLIFNFSEDNQNRITIRPSGTEPKLKMYTQLHLDVPANINDKDLEKLKKEQIKAAKKITQTTTEYFASLIK